MCFIRNGSSYNFETSTIVISMPENLRVHLSLALQIQRKVMFYSKMCFFRNGSLYAALKLVPLWSACLETSGYALEFGPLNTKESDVLFQNVFSQKWIIVQLWNLYHCDQHAWKPQGTLEFGPPNTKESDVLFQNVFLQKQIIIQLWNLDHCNWHTWKPQGLLSLAL